MNTPQSNQPDWEQRVAQARGDVAPPVNIPALLRAVREAEPVAPTTWLDELNALLASRVVAGVCAGGAACLAVVSTWQIWSLWQLLPWVALAGGAGGAP
jgi:hypothetical protein